MPATPNAAAIVESIMHTALWRSTAIIVTYDENGGFWDHVPSLRAFVF
jgi:phospholipase C